MAAKNRDSQFQVKLGDLVRLPIRQLPAPPPAMTTQRDPFDWSTLSREECDREIDKLVARGRDGQGSEIVTIGPVAAEALLARSRGNVRKESLTDIAKLARVMVDGGWEVTSESLELDVDGVFRNGHHRMKAVAMSKATTKFSVMFGTAVDSYKRIDQNRVRQMHNVIGIPSKHAQIVRAVLKLASGKHTHIAWAASEIEDAYHKLGPAFDAVVRGTKTPKYPVGFWAVLICMHGAHPEKTAAFTREVYDGGDVIQSSSRTMREFLLETRGSGAGQSYDARVSAYTMYAIRAYLEGRPLTRFNPRDRDKDGNRVDSENGIDVWFRKQIGV